MYHGCLINHQPVRGTIVTLDIIFGWAASVLCTLLLMPQIFKAWTTKHTDDISMYMLVLSVAGNACWVVHAVLTDNSPLIAGASLICLMSFILIAFKIRFDTRH